MLHVIYSLRAHVVPLVPLDISACPVLAPYHASHIAAFSNPRHSLHNPAFSLPYTTQHYLRGLSILSHVDCSLARLTRSHAGVRAPAHQRLVERLRPEPSTAGSDTLTDKWKACFDTPVVPIVSGIRACRLDRVISPTCFRALWRIPQLFHLREQPSGAP